MKSREKKNIGLIWFYHFVCFWTGVRERCWKTLLNKISNRSSMMRYKKNEKCACHRVWDGTGLSVVQIPHKLML